MKDGLFVISEKLTDEQEKQMMVENSGKLNFASCETFNLYVSPETLHNTLC